MSDLIERQDAIDEVKKHYRAHDNDLLELIAFDIERLPSAQPEHKWETCFDCPLSHGCPKIKGCTNKQAIEYASQIPNDCPLSAQPERKTGKWIDGQNMPEYPRIPYRIGEKYCSECRNEAMRDGDDEQQLTEFCPNCGADMRGEQDGNT